MCLFFQTACFTPLSCRFGSGRRRLALADELRWLAAAQADLLGPLCLQNAGRMVRGVWRDGCLCDTRAVLWPSELAPTQPGEGLLHQGCQRGREPCTSTSAFAHPSGSVPGARPGHRGAHGRGPARVWLHCGGRREDARSRRCGVQRHEGQAVEAFLPSCLLRCQIMNVLRCIRTEREEKVEICIVCELSMGVK